MPLLNQDVSGTIMEVDYAATDAITSGTIKAFRGASGARGLTLFIFSTQAGGAVVNFMGCPRDTARALTTSQPVSANTLLVLDFDHPVPQAQVVFTPTASTAGRVWVEAYSY